MTNVNEETIQSFNLTSKELDEVEYYKARMLAPVEEGELKLIAKTTTNAGLQHLFMERNNLIKLVARNDNLNPRVIPPLLDRITKGKAATSSISPAVSSALHSFLDHKVVVSDVKLFKQVWETSQAVISSNIFRPQDSVNDAANLYYALKFHSIAEGNNANAMSIETLMLILAHLSRREAYGLDPTLASVRDKAVKVRHDEIQAWVSENMPDFEDIPWSWILKMSDLYLDL